MNQYFSNANEKVGSSQEGLWSKLRRDFTEKNPSTDVVPGRPASYGSNRPRMYNARLPQSRKGFKQGKNFKRENDGDEFFDENFDDYEFFDPRGDINTKSMDPLDTMMARAFRDSYHTTGGTVIHWFHNTPRHKLPRVRCISQLATTTRPNIRGVPTDSLAHELAAHAWTVSVTDL
jgi:hypothetical protein